MDKQNAINFQLLGGIWILQTFPAIVFGLYTRWFHRWALVAGWAVGMGYGTVTAYNVVNPATEQHFGGSLGLIPGLAQMGYIAPTAFAINMIVSVLVTFADQQHLTLSHHHMNSFKVLAGEANLLSLWCKSQK